MDSPYALPLEIVIYILKFVSYSDRKQARLTCRQWYFASQDPDFLQQEFVYIQHNNQVADLLNSNRIFQHITFKGSDINWRVKEFWDRFGPCVRSVSLLNCDIHERQFLELLRCCPRLESLRTWGCRDLLMSGCLLSDEDDVKILQKVLCNLKELSIEDNSYLSDALFNRFTAICPHLESLSFKRCQVSFHHGLCKKFYPNFENGGPSSTLASSSIFTFWNILSYVCKNAQQIRRLSLSRTILDSQALTQLAEVANLRLGSLDLSRCEQLTNAGVIALSQSQQYLHHLDLSYCSRVTDAAVISICQNLRHLKHLDLRDCGALTNRSIRELHRLGNVIYLNLSNCNQVTGEGVLNGLGTLGHSANLRKLSLSGMSNLLPDVVARLAHDLPNLTYLDLGYCHTAVTDLVIQAIFKHQIRLRCLELSGCGKVTDAGFSGMAVESSSTGSPSMEVHLDTTFSPKISLRSRAEEDIVKDAMRIKQVLQFCKHNLLSGEITGYSIARLPGLRILRLRGCSRISDVSLCYAFKFLELELLDLTQCHQITNVGLKSLSINCPSIVSLFLDQCLSVTDDAVHELAKNLRRLRTLGLQGCEKLTTRSVYHISEYCDSLRRLDMRGCKGLEKTLPVPRLDKVPEFLLSITFSGQRFPPPMPPPMPK